MKTNTKVEVVFEGEVLWRGTVDYVTETGLIGVKSGEHTHELPLVVLRPDGQDGDIAA